MEETFCFIESRRCYKCGLTQSRTEFSKDRYDKYGLQKICKTCQKERNAIYQSQHRDYWVKHGKARYAAIEDKESYNKGRYMKHADEYKARRAKYRSSPEGRAYDLLYSAKTRAKKKNLTYELDQEWLLDLFQKQELKCSLTKLPFSFEANATDRKKHFNPYAPSIDRIDCTKGYTKDNCRLILSAMNLALNDFGEEVFTRVAEAYLARKSSQ